MFPKEPTEDLMSWPDLRSLLKIVKPFAKNYITTLAALTLAGDRFIKFFVVATTSMGYSSYKTRAIFFRLRSKSLLEYRHRPASGGRCVSKLCLC